MRVRRHQCAAPRAPQAGLSRARPRGPRPPDRDHRRHGRGAPDLLGRRAHHAERAGQAAGGRHRRRQHRADHRRGPHAARAREPADGLRVPERALFPRRQDLRQALRARAPRRAAGARAGAGGVPPPRLGALAPAAPAPCAPSAMRSARSIRRRSPSRPQGTAARHRLLRRCRAYARAQARADHRGSPPGVPRRDWRFSRKCSACWRSRRCASPKARCARGCCTTCSAASQREDARERTVRAMQQRYHVDIEQAERVEATVRELPRADARDLEARGSARGPGAEVGRAAARDRTRRLPQRLSPPRRLSARERRHAGVPARGAAAARAPGRRAPPQAHARRASRSSCRPGTAARCI